jgi:hypothetical protein
MSESVLATPSALELVLATPLPLQSAWAMGTRERKRS